ncbi:MAG TPA: oleate hydratase [Sphingomonas sp.]
MADIPRSADMSADFDQAVPRDDGKVYLVGAGIASLAAAAFMIRDGDKRGSEITILEESAAVGGALDAAGDPDAGYVLRGGRMFESKYLCTFDLFASIPTLDDRTTVTREILDWNETIKTSSRSRLFEHGHRITAPEFGLSEKDILTIERLAIEPESLLGRSSIADHFDPAFFRSGFWLMWCTTFAFQPWHSAVEFKRYLVRFSHMVSGFNRLEGIMRTVYNQYDSMVRPLRKWLLERGVTFRFGTRVTDLRFDEDGDERTVIGIEYERDGIAGHIAVGPDDYVLVTLGSMTEGSSIGSMHAAPELLGKRDGGAWTLWDRIAEGRPAFGKPSVFDDHVDQSKWLSFTVTQTDPELLDLIRDATGNVPGEGGLITFPNSSWLASIVIPHQPHFIGQPDTVSVFWGYGLAIDQPGDFVKKPMSACTGQEILTEILGHLHLRAQTDIADHARLLDRTDNIIRNSICIPCLMPFITSQFLPRQHGDRPDVVPVGALNFAFIGQYCELPDDTVFTVEYSIRSAQTAVYTLLGIRRDPPAVYKGAFDARVLFKAFLALHDLHRPVPASV